MIDDALAEIDRTEADVIALFEELGGPDLATRLLSYWTSEKARPRGASSPRETPPPATP